ncbi:MAG: nodulation protein NfeD [Acidobacteriota bacterium]|nr:nodulation protein NfeD [Acidobacteriota bacterium]
MSSKYLRPALLLITILASALPSNPLRAGQPRPLVVDIKLDTMIHQVSAEYVERGIRYANDQHADAIILELNTPGRLVTATQELVQAIYASHAPVITYVTPSGASAASGGFFVLIAGDLAVMSPGTNTGASHPVDLMGGQTDKTMSEKIESDLASYIRSIAQKRGRNVALADDAVRKSSSFTDKEALDDKLIDFVAPSPREIFAQYDGKPVQRFDGSTTTLHLADADVETYPMGRIESILVWVADPNVAFLLGAIGLVCLYLEFTHPGMVVPGVAGAISLVLALYAFNFMPINYAGVLLIIAALVMFALEAKLTSHGVLAGGGILAMVLGAMILVKSPWPEARIHFPTALSVALPLAFISIILLRLVIAAKKRKAVTGDQGMLGELGVVQTALAPAGKILVHGEIWDARAGSEIPKGTRVRVRKIDGLTLEVEPEKESR